MTSEAQSEVDWLHPFGARGETASPRQQQLKEEVECWRKPERVGRDIPSPAAPLGALDSPTLTTISGLTSSLARSLHDIIAQ